MSYPKDLDEYTEDELFEELLRREMLRRNLKCTYCRRSPSSPPCKFPDRHAPEKYTERTDYQR